MFTSRLHPHIFLIDLKPTGFPGFISSYLIKGKKVAIVETGPTATIPNLLRGMEEIGISVEDVDYVAVSHIHLDHGGGVGKLLSYLPRAKLIVHKRGAPHIVNPERLWEQAKKVLGKVAEIYEKPVAVSSERIIVAEDGMTFELGDNIRIEVVETLGHASHHQSFYDEKSKGVFPGDTAGIYIPEFDVIIPTTPPPLYLETMLASIDKLRQLKPNSLYYSHFGEASNALTKLQMHENQLRVWGDTILRGIRDNATLEELEERIVKCDPAVRIVIDYIRNHPIMSRGIIAQNIQGFMQYFKHVQAKD
ncbi:MAG: MBL fold metallo-hydrolase [Candidatus Bathyarchaeota archaeon]|nr:MBL fold metallo-hydrolase [Candidatus Bathyarchaeota archaeon]